MGKEKYGARIVLTPSSDRSTPTVSHAVTGPAHSIKKAQLDIIDWNGIDHVVLAVFVPSSLRSLSSASSSPTVFSSGVPLYTPRSSLLFSSSCLLIILTTFTLLCLFHLLVSLQGMPLIHIKGIDNPRGVNIRSFMAPLSQQTRRETVWNGREGRQG